jgi:hypothetical protein
MKRWSIAFIPLFVICTGAIAAPKGPEVDLVDNKLSDSAETISLGRLIRLVDLATGMKSKVPAELANRNISVKFAGLDLSDGVRKIFQGQPLDYVLVEGEGIIVTAASQNTTTADSAPAYNQQQQATQAAFDQFSPDFSTPPGVQIPTPQQQLQQQQPATVQTPFGPLPNPRALPQQNAPNNTAQQQSLFPGQNNGQPQQPQTAPTVGFGNPNPFGTPSPFGTNTPPTGAQQNNNSLFGNVPVFNPSATQR